MVVVEKKVQSRPPPARCAEDDAQYPRSDTTAMEAKACRGFRDAVVVLSG